MTTLAFNVYGFIDESPGMGFIQCIVKIYLNIRWKESKPHLKAVVYSDVIISLLRSYSFYFHIYEV